MANRCHGSRHGHRKKDSIFDGPIHIISFCLLGAPPLLLLLHCAVSLIRLTPNNPIHHNRMTFSAQIAASLRCMPALTRRESLKDISSHPLIRSRRHATAASESAASKPAAKTTAAAAESASSSESVPIGTTLVAMSLAIATVGGVAALAETSTASSCPKFDPQSERFDQSTFTGRLSKMLLACDPFLLTYGHEEVMKCKALAENYEKMYQENEGGSEVELNRKLWEAQVSGISYICNYVHMLVSQSSIDHIPCFCK